MLGIVDQGTRACIALTEIADKSSATIWRELLRCFRQFGIPPRIRVDNEACFHGLILRSALGLLGVRVHVSDPGSPWQNGRIERLFGTFKRDLARIVEGDFPRLLAQWRTQQLLSTGSFEETATIRSESTQNKANPSTKGMQRRPNRPFDRR